MKHPSEKGSYLSFPNNTKRVNKELCSNGLPSSCCRGGPRVPRLLPPWALVPSAHTKNILNKPAEHLAFMLLAIKNTEARRVRHCVSRCWHLPLRGQQASPRSLASMSTPLLDFSAHTLILHSSPPEFSVTMKHSYTSLGVKSCASATGLNLWASL